MHRKRHSFLLWSTSILLAVTLTSCQNNAKDSETESDPIAIPTDTVDSTVFATTDTLDRSKATRVEFISPEGFGYYRAFTPPSILLDEKGEKALVNGNPVQVPATVSYIQLKEGKVYGVQVAQGQQFLFTGFYDYANGSTNDLGELNLVLDGRYLKTGKPVGPWNPKIKYSKSGEEISLTLVGVSGASDSKMTYVAPEITTTRMQELMKEEENKLK